MNNLVEGKLQEFVGREGGADNILFFGQKHTEELGIKLEFGINAYECILIPDKADKLIFKDEICYIHDKKQYKRPYDIKIGHGHNESRLSEVSKRARIAKYVYDDLKDWIVYHYHFHDTSTDAKVRLTCDINDNKFLRPDASNLAAFLYFHKKRHPTNYKNIVDTIKLVAPFFEDFMLEPDRLNTEKIRLEWKHMASDKYFNASTLSDGTLRFICLATLFLQKRPPRTIFLDEPELGLHPYAINILSEMMKSVLKKTQIIVSTQSVTFVNQFDLEDVVVVDLDNEESKFKRLTTNDMKEWLDEYGLGDLWEKNLLGGRP